MSARKLSGSEAEQSGRLPPSTPPAGFTPGPWRTDRNDDGTWAIDAPRQYRIGQRYFLGTVYADDEHAEANARLIASAPALYAVVQDFFRAHEELGEEPTRGGRSFGEVLGMDFFKAARAALAAAQPQGRKP